MSCFDQGVVALHRRGLSGAGVRVGFLDTGLDPDVGADLGPRLAGFRTISEDGFETLNGPPRDSGRHGTAMVRSLLAVSPGATILMVEAIEKGDVGARVASGLDWLACAGVDVVCLPLGLPPPAAPVAMLVEGLLDRGVAVVVAAGNGGAGSILAPADLPGVLSVGAIDTDGRVACFSSSADLPFGVAPAVAVSSEGMSGTSSAAARAAGLCALLVESGLHASMVAGTVAATSRPLTGQAHRARFGAADPVAALGWDGVAPVLGRREGNEGVSARLADRLRYAAANEPVSALAAFRDVGALDSAIHSVGALRVHRYRLATVILVSGSAAQIAALIAEPTLVAADTADVDRSAYNFPGVPRARSLTVKMSIPARSNSQQT